MAKEIVMSFDILGNSKLDAQGFQGTSCAEATKNYIQALNAGDKTDKKKPEYSMPAGNTGTVGQSW